jgi:CHASE2 domain-containing sensor protein
LKFFYFWWRAPLTGIEYPKSWGIGYLVYYLVIFLSAVIGFFGIWRTGTTARQNLILIGVFLFGLSLLQSLYYVEGRHRWAVEPILIAVSGGGVATIARRRRQNASGSN